MKSLALLLCVLSFSILESQAQTSIPVSNPIHSNNYCLTTIDGILIVSNNGNILKADITLDDGTILERFGTLKRPDGGITALMEGMCIDRSGKINSQE